MGRVSQGTTTRRARGIRGFLDGVPRAGRILLLGVVVDALGAGLTLPFLVVYLREVRGIPLSTVGLLMSLPPTVALVLLGPIGLAIDRFGARRVQMLALTFSTIGQVALIGVRGPATAALALSLERHRPGGVLPGRPGPRRDRHPVRAPAALLRDVVHHRSTPASASAASSPGWRSTCTGPGPSR